MKHVEPNFTPMQENALKQVAFSIAACSWQATGSQEGLNNAMSDEIRRLETLVSSVAERISDGNVFWHRQIAVVQTMIDLYRAEVEAQEKVQQQIKGSRDEQH